MIQSTVALIVSEMAGTDVTGQVYLHPAELNIYLFDHCLVEI